MDECVHKKSPKEQHNLCAWQRCTSSDFIPILLDELKKKWKARFCHPAMVVTLQLEELHLGMPHLFEHAPHVAVSS